MNFAAVAEQDTGRAPPNRFTGVVSSGATGTEPLGPAIAEAGFTRLARSACRERAGNCA